MLEIDVENAAREWLKRVGYETASGPEIVADVARNGRQLYSDCILTGRLRTALARLNPNVAPSDLERVILMLTAPEGASLVERNRFIHRVLVDGMPLECVQPNASTRWEHVQVCDFEDTTRNDWLAVQQFRVAEGEHRRRLDLVTFLNGLPVGVFEFKNAADETVGVAQAIKQLWTYQTELPNVFACNGLLVASDGVQARVGAIGQRGELFRPWRTIDGGTQAPGAPALQVVIEGMFDPDRFLQLLRHFFVFEARSDGTISKKVAAYHQFHAVNAALLETLRAAGKDRELPRAEPFHQQLSSPRGDRRVGVVWHTQGSGKSLTMAFYVGRVILHPAMENPTVVVITDRNDLDDQLFNTFARCQALLRQSPVQAESRADLRAKLSVAAGGVVFTTLQKFLPEEKGDRHLCLSERRNIVVVADEAHRGQYDFIDGFARHMRDALPHASFIGFTGTPIELADANTRAVFGDYISVYDIQRAVQDGATVPIYYESRLAKLTLDDAERPNIDPDFEEATEGEELERKEKLKSRWAQLEAIVGAEKRLKLIAADIVAHLEQRLSAIEGKAMVVCMSRRICMDLHDEIVRLRPDWFDAADGKGAVKVIMTGSAAEGPRVSEHARNKPRREALANRFRDPRDPLKMVIVRDMWLTGFDAPVLHTMYLDKPMRGHGLMQAIARVNRVFKDKPGGLVVDYLGLAHELRAALATYTDCGGTGLTAFNQEEAVALMLENYEVCCGLFGPITTRTGMVSAFNRTKWTTGTPPERLALLPAAQEHVLQQENGKDRFARAVRELSRAFALAVPHDEALRIRDDVGFFQAVQAVLAKRAPGETRPEEDLDHAVRQIISRAIAPEAVVDIFAAAGLHRPDISILSEEFLAEVRGMPQRNLAVELLQKLLKGELASRHRKNVVQARSFAEMLEQTIRRYQNRAVGAAQVIEELIALAKDIRDANARSESLGLSEDELAFYDALETNDSAVKVLGDETLRGIARELVATVRNNVTIDWTLRENVRAQLRVLVKRILRKHGYPPDKQERATQLVLEQAEALSGEWAIP